MRSMSCHHGRRGWNALYGSPSCPGAESWHKLKALESCEAEKGASKGSCQASAVRSKNLLVTDREMSGENSSSPPDEMTKEKCVLQWSHSRTEPTDGERHSIEAWSVRRLSGSRKHLRMRLAQAWGCASGRHRLAKISRICGGWCEPDGGSKADVRRIESVVFGQIRHSKVSPRCVAGNQCMTASVGPPSWLASVARNVRAPRVK